MPVRQTVPDVVRIVEGRGGTVPFRMVWVLRFDYGSIVPWVRRDDGGVTAVAGPDAVHLRTPVRLRGEDMTTVAEFTVAAGERVPFTMNWPPLSVPPEKLGKAPLSARVPDWT